MFVWQTSHAYITLTFTGHTVVWAGHHVCWTNQSRVHVHYTEFYYTISEANPAIDMKNELCYSHSNNSFSSDRFFSTSPCFESVRVFGTQKGLFLHFAPCNSVLKRQFWWVIFPIMSGLAKEFKFSQTFSWLTILAWVSGVSGEKGKDGSLDTRARLFTMPDSQNY